MMGAFTQVRLTVLKTLYVVVADERTPRLFVEIIKPYVLSQMVLAEQTCLQNGKNRTPGRKL